MSDVSISQMCETVKVIVTCGTGGVGKTSVAASLGVIAAKSGRKVVVITIDPAKRLADAIGLSGLLGNEPQQVDIDATGQLWVTMLDVRETFDNLVRATAPSPQKAETLMENSFYKSLSRSLSGTRDYMAAERLHELNNDERFDLVIVDTPPSRNALDFLESPEQLARFLKHPVVRVLIAPGRGGLRFASAAVTPILKAISSVVGSDALTGVASFLRAFDGMEKEFTQRALAVSRTLRSNDTRFVVVTAPSPDALREADHFVSELSRLKIDLGFVVANRMPPRFGDSSSDDQTTLASKSTGDTSIAHEILANLLIDAERAEVGIKDFMGRTKIKFPIANLTQATEFPTDIHSIEAITLLANQLAAPQQDQ